MKVKPVPDGYHTVTPYLILSDTARALEFYKTVFGANEFVRMSAPGGKIGHAEVRIGDSVIMLADEVLSILWRPFRDCYRPLRTRLAHLNAQRRLVA